MEYISTCEFARIFGISNKTVINLIKQKIILAIRVGGLYRIPKSEIERIRNNKVQ